MDLQKKTLQVGAAAIACALVLRLAPGAVRKALGFLDTREGASLMLYLQTGHIVKGEAQTLPPETAATDPTTPPTTVQEVMAPVLPSFSETDAEGVTLRYHASYDPNLSELLCKPLSWDLTAQTPSVLIVHTHTTESYTKSKGESYKESSSYRTLDEDYNMISIGEALAALLEDAGIGVIHATEIHDHPSYSGSYVNSRKTVQHYLQEYPTIQLVLDLHRDAIDDGSGNQLGTTVKVDGRRCAQLMMVVGTDAGNRTHPNWKENLALALKLHVMLERQTPGLCRSISFRTQRFNQDLSPGALLIEVGAAGNTHEEALNAVDLLARGIIALAHGSQ